jgi:hypothetical protein
VAERNRVTPMGDVVAIALRGQWMGNRGCLHKSHDIVRHHRGRRWIICELEYKGWHAAQWAKNRYTPLFFFDEAVALAAGHRPCALCRHGAYDAYRDAIGTTASADDLDLRLHDERWDGTQRRLHPSAWADVPSGAFVLLDGATPALVRHDRLVPWTTTGYGPATVRPHTGDALVITPPTSCAALRSGYSPIWTDFAGLGRAGDDVARHFAPAGE